MILIKIYGFPGQEFILSINGVVNIFVDFNYYQNTYRGDILTEQNFTKYASKACNYISAETMDRIKDSTISSYPQILIDDIKNCACDLAEKYYDYDKVYHNIINISSGESNSNIKSEKSGEVSITYGASDNIIKNFSDPKYFNKYLLETLHAYIYPRCINGCTYNLTSKIIRDCHFCNLI